MNSTSPRPQIVDQEIRDSVLARGRSFIVQAPAGSGKTELLIQRYLTLLADPAVDEPESVLAITFTRKAAAEMRNRVRDALDAATSPHEPAEPHKKKTRELATAALARDVERGWNLLHDVSRINIRTLDSLCEQIVQSGPYRAGFGSRLGVTEDAVHLYREAARRTVLLLGGEDEQLSNAVEQLLEAADAKAQTLELLVADMLSKRDQWLPILQRAANAEALRDSLQQSLADAVNEDLARSRRELSTTLGCDLPKFLEEGGFTDFPTDLASWKELRDCCFTKDNGVRKNGTFLRQLGESDKARALKAVAKRIQRLPDPQYTEEEWTRLQALLKVLPAAARELDKVFAERGQTDFVEIARAALLVLERGGAPVNARHILVDEFQDTSVLQVGLLRTLMSSWQTGDGRTIFLVGDPMQSIYSFRKAEVTLFERARDPKDRLLPREIDAREITVNFRSQKGLVDWFNATFAEIMTGANAVTGAVSYARADSIHPANNPAVGARSFDDRDVASEAAYIAESIARELAGNSDPKFRVAVLARARAHLGQIVKALREKNIPFRAVDIDPLAERTAIRDLLSLARALTHPGDRTSWLTVLRAPWCGLTLADLTLLCGDSESRSQTVLDLLSQRRTSLSSDAKCRLARIMPVVETAIAQRGRMSLRRLVEQTWTALGGPAAVRAGEDGESDLRDAAAMFEFFDQHAQAGELPDDKTLTVALDRLHSPANADPAVRVELMTMHGAKGLQFDVVFIPGLGRKPQSDGTALLYWREFLNGNDERLLLAPFDPLDDPPKDTIADYIRQAGREASREEAKRLLYVGCTRAKQRLYLTLQNPPEKKDGTPGKVDKESLLALLLGVHSFESLVKQGPKASPPTAERSPNLRRLTSDWAPPQIKPVFEWSSPERREREHTFEWVGRKQRAVGTVTHRFLQQIGRDGLERWTEQTVRSRAAAIRAALVSEGMNEPDLPGATDEVIRGLCAILAHDKGKWILAAHAEAECEFPLSGSDGGIDVRLKLDRTFVDENGTRWIVDYKMATTTSTAIKKFLDQQQEKYRPDLERYARVMRQLDPRPIRMGLYFPLLREWREIETRPPSSAPVQQSLFPK